MLGLSMGVISFKITLKVIFYMKSHNYLGVRKQGEHLSLFDVKVFGTVKAK